MPKPTKAAGVSPSVTGPPTDNWRPHRSDPRFRSLHALRVRGLAPTHTVAEIAGLALEEVEGHLAELDASEFVVYNEQRKLWRLTAEGRDAHAEALAADLAGTHVREALSLHYTHFLEVNGEFKVLCTDWQLRNGVMNDHSDSTYDKGCVTRLIILDERARPVVADMAEELERLRPYVHRLEQACQRVVQGEQTMFTGVMCNSYHDIWMELHEDLLLTQGIARGEEGSF
jgi:hypothetical protein